MVKLVDQQLKTCKFIINTLNLTINQLFQARRRMKITQKIVVFMLMGMSSLTQLILTLIAMTLISMELGQ